jgi:peroxiredoxin
VPEDEVTEPHGAPPPPRRPRLSFLVLGIVLAAVLAVGLFTSLGSSSKPNASRAATGHPAPSFSLPRLGGGPDVGIPTDGGAAGKPAVLLFYASNCVPCQTEIPELAAIYRIRSNNKVAVIGVAAGDPNPKAFAKASGVTFPVGLDNSLDVTEGRYAFTGLPEAVFVKGDGTIAHIDYGAITPAQLLRGEQALLRT